MATTYYARECAAWHTLDTEFRTDSRSPLHHDNRCTAPHDLTEADAVITEHEACAHLLVVEFDSGMVWGTAAEVREDFDVLDPGEPFRIVAVCDTEDEAVDMLRIEKARMDALAMEGARR